MLMSRMENNTFLIIRFNNSAVLLCATRCHYNTNLLIQFLHLSWLVPFMKQTKINFPPRKTKTDI